MNVKNGKWIIRCSYWVEAIDMYLYNGEKRIDPLTIWIISNVVYVSLRWAWITIVKICIKIGENWEKKESGSVGERERTRKIIDFLEKINFVYTWLATFSNRMVQPSLSNSKSSNSTTNTTTSSNSISSAQFRRDDTSSIPIVLFDEAKIPIRIFKNRIRTEWNKHTYTHTPNRNQSLWNVWCVCRSNQVSDRRSADMYNILKYLKDKIENCGFNFYHINDFNIQAFFWLRHIRHFFFLT